jgi:hypothetical protein
MRNVIKLESRPRLAQLVDDVAKNKKTYVIARGKVPLAIISPVKDGHRAQVKPRRARRTWEVLEADLDYAHQQFLKWLREHGYNPDTLTDEQVEQIIETQILARGRR